MFVIHDLCFLTNFPWVMLSYIEKILQYFQVLSDYKSDFFGRLFCVWFNLQQKKMGLHNDFICYNKTIVTLKWPQIKQNKISSISKVSSITVQSDIWQLKRNRPLLLCSAEQKYECGKIYAFKTDAWSNFSIHYSNQSALTRGAKRLISLVFHTELFIKND